MMKRPRMKTPEDPRSTLLELSHALGAEPRDLAILGGIVR